MRNDLSPARGILISVIAGSIIWATILLILWAAFIYEPPAPSRLDDVRVHDVVVYR